MGLKKQLSNIKPVQNTRSDINWHKTTRTQNVTGRSDRWVLSAVTSVQPLDGTCL
ncbi:UNVERIFIED_CONTAM: hypothetical protein FKN15_067446 [Acipenser sinensis]